MHIHRIIFGKHIKLLLRISYRDGRRVKKSTILNLTRWNEQQLGRLSNALQMKRACRGTILEAEADLWILEIIASQGWPDSSKPFQVFAALTKRPAKRSKQQSPHPIPSNN